MPSYYVSPSGSDSNSGSSSSPFQTLQRGVNAANPGDIIIVRDGLYGPGSVGPNGFPVNINKAGTSSAPITLVAEHKWGAVLDGQMQCHSWINLQGASAWWNLQGFEIRNTLWGGLWSNSLGGKNITAKGNHIHHIGNRIEPSVLGIVGIYTDAAALMTLNGNVIHDIGRTNDAGNSFDHGIYSHGNLTIVNHVSYRMLSGWHISTALGFQGLIANCTFYGPNMYAAKPGQIMLWDVQGGPVAIWNCIFDLPNGAAVTTYALTLQPGSSIAHNLTTAPSIYDGSAPIGISNNLLSTDPLLVSPSTGVFSLQANSPAINAGITIPQANPDAVGTPRPQGTAYDLGAYEFIAKFTGVKVYQDDALVLTVPGQLQWPL